MKDRYYQYLLSTKAQQGAGFIVVIDPDGLPVERMPKFLRDCEANDVDAFFLGGSLLHTPWLDQYIAELKKYTTLPVIGFPGSITQVSGYLDAILFLSVISGRNPEHLFGQHVYSAPIIKRLGIEVISFGYMLVESGALTSAQYMSNSMPLPRNKPDIAAATALAAEMMGMKLLMTDGGSGADNAVPDEMVAAITQTVSIPLAVGGGMSTPEMIARKVTAGASFVLVGNALEGNPDPHYIADLAAAAHHRGIRPLEQI